MGCTGILALGCNHRATGVSRRLPLDQTARLGTQLTPSIPTPIQRRRADRRANLAIGSRVARRSWAWRPGGHVRELTRIAEQEMREAVLCPTRERLAALPVRRPVLR